MATRDNEVVLRAFQAIAGDLREAVRSSELMAVAGAQQTARTPVLEALASYAQVFETSPVYQAVRQEDGGGGIASALLRNALGLAPLARMVLGLFGGGGDKEEPPPLVKYALPPQLHFEAAQAPGAGLQRVDYDQHGLPRSYGGGQAAPRAETAPQGAAGPQVTIQVQAMDSRSFLDHKEEIARAVREAMLNTHSLNDVVSDL
jgi:hypothetical protein